MTILDSELRKIALSMDGVTEKPHFDRAAFKVKRNFATLAPEKTTVNLLFLPEEQELRCEMYPSCFEPVPNKWGERGWTIMYLNRVDIDIARSAEHAAWLNGK
ncbi:MmcQ/YjbR family DNA-binding protein [Sphingorhabdus sp. EL138]|uniref:MmcQ/YjbR family DNA-binding protein n=1 Tax=Sphingorhabdus sp. EL138 TaxID=2073156 RepID=UPI000D690F2A|nr:MmcQ/YjbR family DNA-binding protein [Sphingorhabdus sp. EL138]